MDIELLTNEELLDELSTRFEHVVFCGTAPYGKETMQTKRYMKGNRHTCAGLCQDVCAFITKDLIETSERLPE